MRLVFPIPLLALLAACAAQPEALPVTAAAPAPTPEPAALVTIADTPGTPAIAVLGREEAHEPLYLDNAGTNKFRLRSAVDRRSGAIRHELFVEHFYGGVWKRAPDHDKERIWWQKAAAPDRAALPFHAIQQESTLCSTDAGGPPPLEQCHYHETFTAGLEHRALRGAMATGYAVTFTARDGREKVVTVPPAALVAQVQAVEAASARVRGVPPEQIAAEAMAPPVVVAAVEEPKPAPAAKPPARRAAAPARNIRPKQ